MALVLILQSCILILAGWDTFWFWFLTLAVAAGILTMFYVTLGRSQLSCQGRERLWVSLDLCCRAGLWAQVGLLSYFIGSLTKNLPIAGYVAACISVVGICFIACFAFLKVGSQQDSHIQLLEGSEGRDGSERIEGGEGREGRGGLGYPGYLLPAALGLGSWHSNGTKLAWTTSLLSIMAFLGMCGGLMDMAGELALYLTMENIVGFSGAIFVKAFFRDALLVVLFYYTLLCYVLKRHNCNSSGELVMLAVWIAASGGVFSSSLFILSGSDEGFLLAQFSPMIRALLIIPAHCFPALCIAIGVVQLYTVKRSLCMGVAWLVLPCLVAVLMFATFYWSMNMTGIFSDLVTTPTCIIISVLVNPGLFVLFYRNWRTHCTRNFTSN